MRKKYSSPLPHLRPDNLIMVLPWVDFLLGFRQGWVFLIQAYFPDPGFEIGFSCFPLCLHLPIKLIEI